MGMLTFLLVVHLLCPSLTLASFARPQCHNCEQTSYCNCSNQKLRKVPASPSKVITDLDLSFNELQVIMTDSFYGYATLKSLTMKNNTITVIQERALFPLINLEKLDLSFNKLDMLSASWFKKLVSLQYLSLLGNEYRTLGQGGLFLPLKRLKNLQFGGPSLKSVKENDFAGLGALEDLVFHGHNLQLYGRGSFSKIGPINQITLGLNRPFLKNQVLAEVILSDISHPNTTITFIDTRFFSEGQMTPFRVVQQRGIGSITFRNCIVTDKAFNTLINWLSHSNITSFVVEDTKFFLTGDWGHITPQLNIEYLEEVVLKNIDIPQFYSFPALSFLTPLLNVLHRVSVINSRVHTTPCETSAELSELEYIDVSSNLLNDWTLREMMCNGRGVLQGLRTVNVSRNNLKSLNSQLFTQLDKLETLDMSGNQFHSMPEICNWPSSLRILNLSSSHLTKATDCLPKSLYTLDLSHNDLTKFTIELPVLTELYISGNKISSLSNGNLFPALVFLLIQNNALQTFSDNDLKLYKKLKTLEAGAKTFVCSCDFVAFVTSDMTRHRVTLRDGFESYVCESPDAARGERVEDAGLSVFECHTALALSILCSSILIVLLLIAGLCYKFSAVWYLKMTWAWLRAKRRRPVLKKGELRYDAFVSYSERDSGWVEEHLVPELELSEPPLHLCLHKRDFLPGARILDNIMEAIEQSHRTLFVLSRHFVNSEWCKYELDYSHFRLFDQNNDTAVLILLEPIAKETIPKRFCKLRKFMNSRTYLEWPDDDSKIPRFWQSLREAIKTP